MFLQFRTVTRNTKDFFPTLAIFLKMVYLFLVSVLYLWHETSNLNTVGECLRQHKLPD
jgi:hypothetical protein